MTALDAYIKTTKHRTNLWDKLSEEVKSAIEKAINIGKYNAGINHLKQEDKIILERLKYHVYWDDVYWCIVWDIKMK